MGFAFEVVRTVRQEEPELFDSQLSAAVVRMLEEAPAETALSKGDERPLHFLPLSAQSETALNY